MSATEFTALLVLATAMSFTPGPNTTLATALAANHGFKHALPFVCAVPVGFGALLCVCALGLGAMVLALPLLGWGVKLAGVAYLLWLAWKLTQTAHLAQADAARMDVTFWQGAGLQFMNIKGWMLALAIVGGWIVGRGTPLARLAIVLPVLVVFTFASTLSYALVGSLLRGWLAGPQGSGARLRWFNRGMAAVLALTAAWMVTV
jgi:threonine/homoserine/homoserine lactone efflux protein